MPPPLSCTKFTAIFSGSDSDNGSGMQCMTRRQHPTAAVFVCGLTRMFPDHRTLFIHAKTDRTDLTGRPQLDQRLDAAGFKSVQMCVDPCGSPLPRTSQASIVTALSTADCRHHTCNCVESNGSEHDVK